MRAKPCIAGCTLLLALTVICAKNPVFAAPSSPATSGAGSSAQWKSIQEDSASWRREPFKNLEDSKQLPGPAVKQGSTGASPDLVLQGIMKSNKHYYAIINGRTVKSGDRIDGWNIAEISRNRVTIRRENEKQIYDIYQGRIDRGSR